MSASRVTARLVEGDWTYERQGCRWVATNTTTGQVLAPASAATVPDIRRAVYEAAPSVRVTVVSGPGRALSARRFTGGEA